MMKKINWIAFLTIFLLVGCSKSGNGDKPKDENGNETPDHELIGQVLPDWEEGYLDIHAINTGRGESTLLIFPDGTTMLIDAASSLISPNHEVPPVAQKPNINVAPGLTITNYARHFIKSASNKLNYMLLTHFDHDHIGGIDDTLPMDPTGTFRMGGFAEVGAKLPVDKIIDRAYPTYDFPRNLTGAPRIANYISFLEWTKSARGTEVEQFVVGRNDQIVLTENPSKYPNFKVQNIVGNGVVWTGIETGTRNTFPSAGELVAASASENIFSLGFEVSYGKFDYFTAGDLQYNGRSTHPWKDIEAPVAAVVSEVDVMKGNHHATLHCNGTAILSSLKPETMVIHTWRDVQPNPETISRMFNTNPTMQVFTTNLTSPNRTRLGADYNKLKATQGHIVVRVSPGGEEYYVYVLDDNNQDYKVTDVFGPYKSK